MPLLHPSISRSTTTEGMGEEGWWNRELARETDGVSREGLRTLRKQIDEGAPASQTIETIVNDVIAEGQELLTTEVNRRWVGVCRCVDDIARRCPSLVGYPLASAVLVLRFPQSGSHCGAAGGQVYFLDQRKLYTPRCFTGWSRLKRQANKQLVDR